MISRWKWASGSGSSCPIALPPGNLQHQCGKLLQDRGLLANIQSAEGPDWAEAASPAPYAGFHVTGTKWMPPRDWTDVNMDSVLEQFVEEVLEYAVRS